MGLKSWITARKGDLRVLLTFVGRGAFVLRGSALLIACPFWKMWRLVGPVPTVVSLWLLVFLSPSKMLLSRGVFPGEKPKNS